MPRPLWTGALSFGLVNVPVSLVAATRDLDIRFHQVHAPDGAPIEIKRYCSAEEIEVDHEEIARAYELESGGQVLLSDNELEAIAPERTRTIEIERFVDLAEVDPVYFAHPYLLEPRQEEAALKAYRLLERVMASSRRAALGRFVMRTKEYLAIVRPRDGVLTLETMRFATEVRATAEIDAGDDAEAPDQRMLETALAVIEELSVDWKPDAYEDQYRARLQQLIERKRSGEEILVAAADSQPQPAPDLMAALEATLAQLDRSGERGAAKVSVKRRSSPKSAKSKQ